jgi:hypothetical protein
MNRAASGSSLPSGSSELQDSGSEIVAIDT